MTALLRQRRCSCGRVSAPGGECAACRAPRLSRQASLAREPRSRFAPSIVHDVVRSPGHALPAAVRREHETRFGHDFSRVRVHTDERAARSASAVDALAYTVGRDIVFAQGSYAPETAAGRRLLVHELAHVVQQADAAPHTALPLGASGDASEREAERVAVGGGVRRISSQILQRYTYGKGAAPDPTYAEVPAAEARRVEQAMVIVSRIVGQPKKFKACHDFFKNNCPGGTDSTLTDMFNAAVVWKDTDPDPDVLGSSVGPHNIAYTSASYGIGRWAIAASMIHELIHNCGIHGVVGHTKGDLAKSPCGRLPDI